MNSIAVFTLFGLFSAAYSAEGICGKLGDGALVPNRYDCTKYYECAQGRLVQMNCNPGLQFNEIDNICDSPQNSACHVFDDGHHRASKLQKLCEYNGDGSLFPDISDCSKFYECTFGKPVQMACPKGLLYSFTKKYCEYPEKTACATALPSLNHSNGIMPVDEQFSN